MASTNQVVATPAIHGPSYTRPPVFDGTVDTQFRDSWVSMRQRTPVMRKP